MKLTYPINLIGLENGASSGDVVTRDGEYLGTWMLVVDEVADSGEFQFFVDGDKEPKFSEYVSFLDSRTNRGMAVSNLCGTIRQWRDEDGPSNG